MKMTSRRAVRKEGWAGDGAGDVGGEDEVSMVKGEEEDGDREVRKARSVGDWRQRRETKSQASERGEEQRDHLSRYLGRICEALRVVEGQGW